MKNALDTDQLIISRQRVEDHGEVFTGKREVNAMLDLVAQETERIESRFLEQACGTGNFLVEILSRKLTVVGLRYKQSQADYEWYAAIAVSSVYGIDIQHDNVQNCRNRLFSIVDNQYLSFYKGKTKEKWRNAIHYLLEKNIVWGDALSLKTVGEHPKSIIFPEWSPLKGGMFKRRDFSYEDIMPEEGMMFFGPLKEYPVTHLTELCNEH
jgi:hypothetical protein